MNGGKNIEETIKKKKLMNVTLLLATPISPLPLKRTARKISLQNSTSPTEKLQSTGRRRCAKQIGILIM